MEVILYEFSKKENSTKVPTTTGTSFNCIIKKESGLISPVIELNIGLNEAPTYNYAYIPAFNRYYFIEEWNNKHPLWQAIMKVDVLSSWKTEIGNSNLYILRSSASYDGSITDMMYPTNTNITTYTNPPPQFLVSSYMETGTFVIGVVDTSANFGSISYYALNYYAMAQMVQALLNDNFVSNLGMDIKDGTLALQKSLIDPISYVKSCVFIPYPYNDFTGTSTSLSVWGVNLQVACKKVGTFVSVGNSVDFTLPKHPQATTRGNYCNVSPYTDMRLLFAPFGEIPLDTMYLKNKSTLHVSINIDVTNGIGMLTVTADNDSNYIIHRSEAMVGVNISLSQVTKDYIGGALGVVGGIGTTIGSGLSGSIGGITSGILSAIGSGLNFITPRLSTGTNSSGTFITLYPDIKLLANFYEIVEDDNSHHGRPLCINAMPKDYGGYLLIQDGDIEVPCTSNELQSIKQYLEGGFYYE